MTIPKCGIYFFFKLWVVLNLHPVFISSCLPSQHIGDDDVVSGDEFHQHHHDHQIPIFISSFVSEIIINN